MNLDTYDPDVAIERERTNRTVARWTASLGVAAMLTTGAITSTVFVPEGAAEQPEFTVTQIDPIEDGDLHEIRSSVGCECEVVAMYQNAPEVVRLEHIDDHTFYGYLNEGTSGSWRFYMEGK